MTRRRLALVPLLVLAVVSMTGCYRSLFPEQDPRTQFEVYDLQRQRYVPKEEPDVFGHMQPALRARLSRR